MSIPMTPGPRQTAAPAHSDSLRAEKASDLSREMSVLRNNESITLLVPGVSTLSLINKELEMVEEVIAWRKDIGMKLFVGIVTIGLTLANWCVVNLYL